DVVGGLEGQAAYICNRLIPEVLQRREGRNFSDIAVLYRGTMHGDIVVQAATDVGFKHSRFDNKAPYPRTLLIRWIKQCAAWCSGGWQSNSPRLRGLLTAWSSWNNQMTTDRLRIATQRRLTSFLWTHCDPMML